MGHFEMRDTSYNIQYSAQTRRRLLMKQKSLKKFCCLLNVKDELLENIQASQIELDQFYELKSKEVMIRCRAKWFLKGKKTKHFLNLGKSGLIETNF